MSKKQQLLDPVCTIVRLILLNFNLDGTKIHVYNNKIDIDPPHKIQSIERFIYGDSRNDICILGNAINNYIIYYLEYYKNDTTEDIYKILCILTKYACFGLKKLQKTYYELNNKIFDNCIYTIQYFIIILLNSINNIHYDSKFLLIPFEISFNLLDDQKLKNLWNIEDIKELYMHSNKCFHGDIPLNLENSENLTMITTLVSSKEKKLSQLLKTTNNGL